MEKLWQKQKVSGFTLIELLIVIAIISILSTVIAISSIESGQQSRDEKRQADLRNLQSAIELYKNKNGRYPEGCKGADQWSGQKGGSYACAGGDARYIVGLAPEFISVLPLDPKLGGGDGYAYTTNSDGTVYKLMAMETVESEVVTDTHKFASCDINSSGSGNNLETDGWCYDDSVCQNGNPRFQTSYGVWGGFAPLIGGTSLADFGTNNAKLDAVEDTTDIICK